MLVRVWSVWLIICFCRELPLKQNWPISSPSLEANSIGMKWYINIPRTFFKMVFFVFFRFGEINVFFLHFLCWWWWRWGGEESSTRGDVMPMISLFSLLSPNGWCHVYFWLNIRFLWDSYNYSDLKMEGSFPKIVLAPNLRLQLSDSRKIFRQKSAQSG